MGMFRSSGLAALMLLTACGAATAGCYDVFGCSGVNRFRLGDLMNGPNCEFLYEMRNGIYAEHHYCFVTPRAIAMFGNAGCRGQNPYALGMNSVELGNATTILQAEHAKGCPE
jgi:hypothetical protein